MLKIFRYYAGYGISQMPNIYIGNCETNYKN
jgi:hypothetical protein